MYRIYPLLNISVLYCFYPQVGIGRDRTLYALYHGRVVMTTEIFNPNWNHKIMRRFGTELKKLEDIPIYKTYFHILTEPQKTNFKLVDQV